MTRFFAASLSLALGITSLLADDIRDPMKAAGEFGRSLSGLLDGDQVLTFWSPSCSRLVCRIDDGRNSHQFIEVDLKSGAKTPAFDHADLANALTKAASRKVSPQALPLEHMIPDDAPGRIRFRAFGKGWSFQTAGGNLTEDDSLPESASLLSPREITHQRSGNGPATSLTVENATGGEIEMLWVEGRDKRRSYGRLAPGKRATQSTYTGHLWLFADASGKPIAGIRTPEAPSLARVTGPVEAPLEPARDTSPDGKWRVSVRNHNLVIHPVDGGEPVQLTTDGNPGQFYGGPIEWSPDSRFIAARHIKQPQNRKIHIVESSPADQVQPKLRTIDYNKPGDAISQAWPVIFNIASRLRVEVDSSLFANPWNIRDGAWSADSSEYSFVYNQRGHQVMRILAIRSDSGSTRVIHEEASPTFIDYSQKYFFQRLERSATILWASERDGHNHLYRIDPTSGSIRNAVTSGPWNVRRVLEVDEETGSVLLIVNGMPGSDPYHEHLARVNFDGSGFTRLTTSDGNHRFSFSPDRRWIIAKWSRVDHAPVTELRAAVDGRLVAELSRADDSALVKAGWSRPERFVAKGRDGKTDIHGIIVRPSRFDPSAKYPVLEDIYAGPHDFFVPKNHSTWSGLHAMAELGFIVVKIDGMGTNWRSKQFHDNCWKNLSDGGMPDRVAWIKAAAATRPWMDLERVGIFGGSAGGQNALSAMLHHGDFYKAAVADCGCHDNRMDKIWWNEAWMGWPVDESYARNSNVTHAHKLRGKLMLIVGELDDNVDPASTTQVVAALQKEGKVFDFVPVINAGHGAAETPYGSFRRADFLVRHLGATPVVRSD